ncbi:unnamed protein product [marine sediment metagenome]|uniref:HTH merR-type domain-containing protein n=1 Tax=marine sediment metagenome TaxID=412755 RepID=X1H7B8_9ZZZZ
MPTPKLELAAKYLTSNQARKRLDLSLFQLNLRIERGIFPRPTYVDETGIQSVRYFDENWVRIAQAILDNAVKEND